MHCTISYKSRGALQIQDWSPQLRPVASECVCDWLRDATGLDCGDRSWICNAPLQVSKQQLDATFRLLARWRYATMFFVLTRIVHNFNVHISLLIVLAVN